MLTFPHSVLYEGRQGQINTLTSKKKVICLFIWYLVLNQRQWAPIWGRWQNWAICVYISGLHGDETEKQSHCVDELRRRIPADLQVGGQLLSFLWVWAGQPAGSYPYRESRRSICRDSAHGFPGTPWGISYLGLEDVFLCGGWGGEFKRQPLVRAQPL